MHLGLIFLSIYLFIGLIIYFITLSDTYDKYNLLLIPFWPLILIILWILREEKKVEGCGCN